MPVRRNSLRKVKQRVFDNITEGIDRDNDPCDLWDDIVDSSRYAVDVTIFETAHAVFEDVEKLISPVPEDVQSKLNALKRVWCQPVLKSEFYGSGCSSISVEIPDEFWETERGKKVTAESNEIIQSIEKHQKKQKSNKSRK